MLSLRALCSPLGGWTPTDEWRQDWHRPRPELWPALTSSSDSDLTLAPGPAWCLGLLLSLVARLEANLSHLQRLLLIKHWPGSLASPRVSLQVFWSIKAPSTAWLLPHSRPIMTQETEKFQEVGEQAGASLVLVMIYGCSYFLWATLIIIIHFPN